MKGEHRFFCTRNGYLLPHFSFRFKPGSFSCSPPIWQTCFPLHSRVKQSQVGELSWPDTRLALKSTTIFSFREHQYDVALHFSHSKMC